MTKRQSSKTPVVQKKSAKDYPYTDRWFTIGQRIFKVVEKVHSLLEGPATRSRFQEQINSLLDDAAFAFCKYLYAEANGPPVAAAEYLDEVQGLLEYELPLGLLQPVRNSRDRAKALKAIMPTLVTKITKGKKLTEGMYLQATAETNLDEIRVWGHFRLKKPLVRPAKQRFREFPSWVDYVVGMTFEYADESKADSGPKNA